MSNPGVISLAANPKFKLKIEDNVAEAIHIHYENIRLDLTVEEFEKLAGCMNGVIDEIVSVKDFSSCDINPENLVQISVFLPKLLKAEKTEVYLKDLLVNSKTGKYVSIKKIKQKQAGNRELASQNEQIILFGNKNYVICGQENCKTLYHINGNARIPVTRLFFDKSVTIKDIQKEQKTTSLLKKIIKIIKWIIWKISTKFN